MRRGDAVERRRGSRVRKGIVGGGMAICLSRGNSTSREGL